jgi:predicted Zn-dependent protease
MASTFARYPAARVAIRVVEARQAITYSDRTGENTMTIIENLHGMLERGIDTALLRYSLGNELLKAGDADAAIAHLREALKLDREYSAAWKVLGKALSTNGRHAEAVDVLGQGIEVAERRGDVQAAKEMGVFRKRAQQAIECETVD